jgi:hypothetical protein
VALAPGDRKACLSLCVVVVLDGPEVEHWKHKGWLDMSEKI